MLKYYSDYLTHIGVVSAKFALASFVTGVSLSVISVPHTYIISCANYAYGISYLALQCAIPVAGVSSVMLGDDFFAYKAMDEGLYVLASLHIIKYMSHYTSSNIQNDTSYHDHSEPVSDNYGYDNDE